MVELFRILFAQVDGNIGGVQSQELWKPHDRDPLDLISRQFTYLRTGRLFALQIHGVRRVSLLESADEPSGF